MTVPLDMVELRNGPGDGLQIPAVHTEPLWYSVTAANPQFLHVYTLVFGGYYEHNRVLFARDCKQPNGTRWTVVTDHKDRFIAAYLPLPR